MEQERNYDSVIKEEQEKYQNDFGQLLVALNNMFGYPEGARLLSEYLKKQAGLKEVAKV